MRTPATSIAAAHGKWSTAYRVYRRCQHYQAPPSCSPPPIYLLNIPFRKWISFVCAKRGSVLFNARFVLATDGGPEANSGPRVVPGCPGFQCLLAVFPSGFPPPANLPGTVYESPCMVPARTLWRHLPRISYLRDRTHANTVVRHSMTGRPSKPCVLLLTGHACGLTDSVAGSTCFRRSRLVNPPVRSPEMYIRI